MKTSHRYLLPLLGLSAGLLAPLHAQPAPDGGSKPALKEKQTKELRVLVGRGGPGHAGVETAPVTFLGVETSRAGGTLAAQLGLAQGVGLVVNALVPGSPAAGVLQRHDLLTKLNDQLLVDSGQLGVLVRSFKEGDEVSLTFFRGGKETTAKVKLATRGAPKLTRTLSGTPGDRLQELPGRIDRVEVDRLLSRLHGDNDDADDAPAPGTPHVVEKRIREARPITTIINKGMTNLVYNDDTGSLELKLNAGMKDIVAKNAKGEVLYTGPVNTDEERARLTPEARALLEKVENVDGLSFKTDGDFEGGDVKVLVPGAKRISLPLPAPTPRADPLRSL